MSKNLHIHFLNASNELTKADISTLEHYISEVLDKTSEVLDIAEIDYVIKNDSERTIESIGVCGNAYEKNQVTLYIDKNFSGFPESIKKALQATVVHETHHVMRERAGTYGATLLDAMVAEGLADHFSEEVMNNKNMWHNKVYANVPDMIDRSKKELDSDSFDYAAWFFGSKEKGIPRYTGYAMGYRIVGRYLHSKNETAGGSVATLSKNFKEFLAEQ